MVFEDALATELETIAAISDRVYPFEGQEQTYDTTTPYLIYASSEGLRDKTLGGYLDSKSVRGELNIMAPRYGDVKSITSLVIDKLISMEQRVIGTDGPYIEELTYEEPVELYEDKPKLYRCVIDFEVYF